MAEMLIRIGRVSSVNDTSGLVSVTYTGLDDSTTDEFPVFSFTDEYKMPGIGQEVLVLHLSNGQSAGIVMGRMWNNQNQPPKSENSVFRKELGKVYGEAYIEYGDGNIVFKDENAGPVTLKELLECKYCPQRTCQEK